MELTATLIVNPESGQGNGFASSAIAVQHLRARGWDATIVVAQDRSQITSAARSAIATSTDLIVACGGDGTVGAVAGAVAGSSTSFGVIPAGTLNHFARDMHLPLKVERAAEVFTSGRVRHIDIGEVNGFRFVNNSSLGLYPALVRYCEGRERRGSGRIQALAAGCALTFRRFRSLHLRLDVEGEVIQRTTPFLFVGNNAYEMEGLHIGHRLRLDQGKLALYLMDGTGRFHLLGIALSAVLRRLRQNHHFRIIHTQNFQVLTRRKRIRVALDGEVVTLHPPLRYSIRPGFLKMIVP